MQTKKNTKPTKATVSICVNKNIENAKASEDQPLETSNRLHLCFKITSGYTGSIQISLPGPLCFNQTHTNVCLKPARYYRKGGLPP